MSEPIEQKIDRLHDVLNRAMGNSIRSNTPVTIDDLRATLISAYLRRALLNEAINNVEKLLLEVKS